MVTSESNVDVPPVENEGEMSKKAAKKAAAAAEKAAKKAAREAELAAAQKGADALMNKQAEDVNSEIFGYLPLCTSKIVTGRTWTKVGAIDDAKVGQQVWVRARLQDSRCKGSLGFIVLRERVSTIQAVLAAGKDETTTEDKQTDQKSETTTCPKEMIKWASGVPLESIVDVLAVVTVPAVPVESTSQKVELAVLKFFVVSKSAPELPFQLKDANRPDNELDAEGAVRVTQEIRLDNRILDLRTAANQSIFSVSSAVCTLFREYLLKQDFVEIHSPKLQGGTSEGGSNVFRLKYFGSDACLAQSPQLFKQMAICGDMDRVFEIAPVFRAENSNTHRHLCEFVGLDLEMAIKEHYNEVLDVIDELFQYIFKGLNERCRVELNAVYAQHPNREFKWLSKCPRIDFQEGAQMLRDAGVAGIPDDLYTFDLSTEQEKTLGRLVFEKYDTDFYMLINFPLGVRPFYTMPSPFDPRFSNSFDIFMRGEEIISGAQRVHEPGMLAERATACGIPLDTIKSYIDSFKLGAFPHGGCGVGLERVVMLFLGLSNIRKSSMFPRDPKRIAP